MRTGMDAANSKNWQACIDALTSAIALEKDAKASGQLGLCEENAARFTDAYGHLMQAVEKTTPEMSGRQPWARYDAALQRVIARVVLLVVTVFPPDSYVLLDGRPLGKADGRIFAVAPGKHVLTARHAGYEDASDPRTWSGGDVPTAHFQLKPLPAALPTAMPVPSALPVSSGMSSVVTPASSTPAPLPTAPALQVWAPLVPELGVRGAVLGLGYASFALGLVATGFSIGLEVDRASMAAGHPSDTCSGSNTTSSFCATLHERREQRNEATAAAISLTTVGVLTSLAAVVPVWIMGRKTRAVAPVIGKDSGGIVVRGAW